MENKNQKIDKTFGLTSFALNNSTTVLFLTFLIIVMGVSTYITLPRENFPEINIPKIYIGVTHPGNSPTDIENLITRPIEKELNTISEVDNITSTSVQDHSTIIAEFTADTEVEDALSKVKDAVDKAQPELPTDLDREPNVFAMDVSEFPILNINLSGNYSLDELKGYAEYLEDELERIKEISKAEIRGVDDKEVKIKVDPYKLVLETPQAKLPHIYIDCGVSDFLYEPTKKFMNYLLENKITFTFGQSDGTHEEDYWGREVQKSMAIQYSVMLENIWGREFDIYDAWQSSKEEAEIDSTTIKD
jgi:hypothetical protein